MSESNRPVNGEIADAGDFPTGVFQWLATPLVVWNSQALSTVGKTLVDLSVVGVPAGVKGILSYMAMRDSASAGGDYGIWLSPNNTDVSIPDLYVTGISCGGLANDRWTDRTIMTQCDTNGDIYYQVLASGASTMDATWRILGYWM